MIMTIPKEQYHESREATMIEHTIPIMRRTIHRF